MTNIISSLIRSSGERGRSVRPSSARRSASAVLKGFCCASSPHARSCSRPLTWLGVGVGVGVRVWVRVWVWVGVRVGVGVGVRVVLEATLATTYYSLLTTHYAPPPGSFNHYLSPTTYCSPPPGSSR
eukprot:scaffold53524_cov45-Phaeocystis_antarctica.AAC.3